MKTTLSEIIEAIGWTLVHFLWQGTAIALGLLIFFAIFKRWRYPLATLAMLSMLACAIVTFSSELKPPAVEIVTARTSETASTAEIAEAPAATPVQNLLSPVDNATGTEPGKPLAHSVVWLPWMVALWILGVIFFSLRLLLNWRSAQQLRRYASPIPDHPINAKFAQLLEQLKISTPVKLLSSANTSVPMVIGAIKPAIILPTRLLTGFDAQQLEAIVAHELAHVRRHDYLVNLLQNLLEAMFFYHPAVWWVSKRMRQEREHSCDDIAAKLTGGALVYGRALAALEQELCEAAPIAGVAANGGSLLQRIRRLTGIPEPQRSPWPALLVCGATASIVALSFLINASAQDDPTEPEETEDDHFANELPIDILSAKIKKELSWGQQSESGLSAAISLIPNKGSYPLGAKIEREYVVANFGSKAEKITIGHWLEDDYVQTKAIDEIGGKLDMEWVTNSGLTALIEITLNPGEFVRAPAPPVFLKPTPRGEGVSPAGAYLDVAVGKTVRLSAKVELFQLTELPTGVTEFIIAEGKPEAEQPAMIRSVNTEKKVFGLAFEDGPHFKNTPVLLDLLKERGVKATFFVVGLNAKRYPDLIKRIVAEGHEIGNHTMKHPNLSKMDDAGVKEELRECHDAIVDACGVAPKLMRPPYGMLKDSQIGLIDKEFGYQAIAWSIDPEDWKRPGPEIVANRLIDGAKPGAITILHEIHAPTITAMPKAIDGLIKKGYTITTVGAMLAGGSGGQEKPKKKGAFDSRRTILDGEVNEIVRDPKKTLEAFLQADTVDELLNFVAYPEQVSQEIRQYYKDGKRTPIAGEIRFDQSGLVQGTNLTAYQYWVTSARRKIPVSVEETKQGYRVDWAAFTQFHDSNFEKFLHDTKNPGGEFYLQLRRSHYFENDLADIDDWHSFRIQSPIAPSADGFAFLKKSNPEAKAILEQYRWGNRYFPYVELGWFTPEGGEPRIELRRIIRPHWRR